MRDGFDIAMVGIDGIGKSSLAAALVARLRRLGHPAVQQSWQSQLAPHPSTFEQRMFTDLWHVLVRSLYREAVLADGRAALAVLPAEPAAFFKPEIAELLDNFEIVSNHGRGILSAGSVQLAGDLLLRRLVVEPLTQAGQLVVQDSHGVKSLVKHALLAAAAAEAEASARFLAAVEDVFFEHIRPAIGIVVIGDPEISRQRRLAQRGRLGALEHFGLAGKGGPDTYLEFQSELQQHLVRIAKNHGWIEVSLPDLPVDQALCLGVDTILADERISRLLDGSP